MIVSFSVENWMSFLSKTSFSMIATRERQHGERVPKIAKYQFRLLPIAAVYGGNASGKTNLFMALNFVRGLIIEGTQPDNLIPVEPFKLDAKSAYKPSSFNIVLLVKDTVYEYNFVINQKEVLEEKLVQITSSNEIILYHRYNGEPHFHESLEDDKFLEFAFQGTRSNQLFLTNSVSQNVTKFRPVYDWFKDTLELVAPDSRFGFFDEFLDESSPLYATMNELLLELDTGISHLGGEEVLLENAPFPPALKKKIQEDVKEGSTVRLMSGMGNERFVVTRKEGKLIAKKLVAYHSKADGTEAKFDIYQESDGSQRIIDLLPAFLELSAQGSNKVYVIDEIDRSLHTVLTRKLLEAYLATCSQESRSQLLMTTHDVALMDQKIFRRDEMWVTEREGSSGQTTLFSFSEFKEVRFDKDIRKSYLQGRLGGIPMVTLAPGVVGTRKDDEKELSHE
jgi:uncharacterized protein